MPQNDFLKINHNLAKNTDNRQKLICTFLLLTLDTLIQFVVNLLSKKSYTASCRTS